MKRLPIFLGLLIVLTGQAVIPVTFATEGEEVVINYPELPNSIPVMTSEQIESEHVTVPGKWQTLFWGFVVGVMILSLATKKPRQKPESAQ